MIAALPMYDWPEVREETERFWAILRDHLRAFGFDAPEDLARPRDLMSVWRSSDLLITQTCGLPYAVFLKDHVTLIGTPHYGCDGCIGSFYSSAIIVRADDPAPSLGTLRGARVAVNDPWSQSGRAAWHLSSIANEPAPFFADAILTASHRASLHAVASGEARTCAVDAVCWWLFARHATAVAASLRVLEWTSPTPGLPFIARAGLTVPERTRIQVAIESAIRSLDPATRSDLGLTGFSRTMPDDYQTPVAVTVSGSGARDRLLASFVGSPPDRISSSFG